MAKSVAAKRSNRSSEDCRGGVGYGCQGGERWCRRCKSNCRKGDSCRRTVSVSVRVHDVLHVLLRIVFPAVLIAKSVPANNAVVHGFVDGARAASDTVDQMKGPSVGPACQSAPYAVQIEQREAQDDALTQIPQFEPRFHARRGMKGCSSHGRTLAALTRLSR